MLSAFQRLKKRDFPALFCPWRPNGASFGPVTHPSASSTPRAFKCRVDQFSGNFGSRDMGKRKCQKTRFLRSAERGYLHTRVTFGRSDTGIATTMGGDIHTQKRFGRGGSSDGVGGAYIWCRKKCGRRMVYGVRSANKVLEGSRASIKINFSPWQY